MVKSKLPISADNGTKQGKEQEERGEVNGGGGGKSKGGIE